MPSSSVNAPRASSRSATASTSSATYGVNRANRPRGSSAPSRTARIGETRVARRDGTNAASTVTTIPITNAKITVRGAITMSAVGRSRSSASNSASSPYARPTPRKKPTIDAIRPITSASRSTARRICFRDAPIVRSVASSRVRCATVIDIVLKMTKAPTKRATAPKESRK